MVEVGVDRKIEIGFGKVNRTVGLVANRVDDGIGLVERLVDIDDRIEGEVAWVGRSIALVDRCSRSTALDYIADLVERTVALVGGVGDLVLLDWP